MEPTDRLVGAGSWNPGFHTTVAVISSPEIGTSWVIKTPYRRPCDTGRAASVTLSPVTEQKRRRIDMALDGEFASGLETLDLDEVRRRRDLAEEAERELSYYRRLLHGRMDLLAFEMRRRRGEETRTLIEALPEILSPGTVSQGRETGELRHLSVELDLPPVTGRRDIDQVLEGDALARVTSMEMEELAEVQLGLTEAERSVSDQRRRLHEVIDRLQAEIIDRYKRGLNGSESTR